MTGCVRERGRKAFFHTGLRKLSETDFEKKEENILSAEAQARGKRYSLFSGMDFS